MKDKLQAVQVFAIQDDAAEKSKRKALDNLSSMLVQFFNDGTMKRTLEAMTEEPPIGEPKGNCHNIALAFMVDLIMAKQARGWFWMRGGNPLIRWEHSWLEYDGFAVDATATQKDNPHQPTVTIGEINYYYKSKKITKILKKRDAAQTRRWIFRRSEKHG